MPEAQRPQKVPLVFFCTESGSEPVRGWLKSLDEIERHANRQRLAPGAMALAGRHASVPAARQGLWEIRTNLPHHRTSRVLLCFCENHLVALHAFIKKTRAMPKEDLLLARRRQKELTG